MVSTTSWRRSPRTSASHPGTRHEVSRGLDTGAIKCPVSESVDPSSEESQRNLPRVGCPEEHQFREPSLSGPVRRHEQDLPLVLPDLAQCLTGGTHTCEGPVASWVPLCPYRVFPRSGSKTTGNERSLKMQKVYLIKSVMSPNQLDHLGMDSPGLVAEVRSRTTFQSEKLNMRCTCCLLILTLWSVAAECNNRMPMCIGSFSYTQSGLVSLREIPIRQSPDVSRSDRLKGISELLKWCSNLPKYSMISIWTEIRFF